MSHKSDQQPSRLSVLQYSLIQIFLVGIFLALCLFLEHDLHQDLSNDALVTNFAAHILFLENETYAFLPRAWVLFFPVLLVALSFLVLQRLRYLFLGLWGLLFLGIFIGNKVYFQFFSSLVSIKVVVALGQVWDVRSSVFSYVGWVDVLVFAAFITIMIVGWRASGRYKVSMKEHLEVFIGERLLGILLFGYAVHLATSAFQLPIASQAKLYGTAGNNFVPEYMSSSRDFGYIFGTLNYQIKDLVGHLLSTQPERVLTPPELDLVDRVLDASYEINREPSPLSGIAKGRNVLVISMEAFQYFLIDLKLEGQEITPHMNQLFDSAIRLEYALDNVSRGGTSDAEFSILTGLFSDFRKPISLTLNPKYPLLSMPATLHEQGYETFSFHGYKRSFWNRNINHPLLGIDHMVFMDDFEGDGKIGFGLSDEVVFTEAAETLTQLNDPFFGFIISLSTHHPYSHVKHSELKLSMNKSMARNYLASANYADKQLGQLLQQFKDSGTYENTVFVIYGDHRAALDEPSQDVIYNLIGVKTMSPRAARIPLIIAVPGQEALIAEQGNTYKNVVTGLQDVFPSVLHLLGLDIPAGVYGTNIFYPNVEARLPLPFYRTQSSIIFQGSIYNNKNSKPYYDESGVVFLEPESEVSKDELSKAFSWVRDTFYVHQLIFDQNAQAIYRERFDPSRFEETKVEAEPETPSEDSP